ncbi:COMM domain-containing protein 3 isoform X2 [Pelodiscus sinensis]|uniref:COMM domain-containing protein 3 isoform X2 n=1 Tax=Pelodiscus sinensis TaxID=13735 RepID=UPI0003C4B8CA|nr:COMM domain-containing protein 3 isoform X2 [Pelodiscus sinensis]|eukprot:XP_006119584.1 COMM domain-containing protein 3 isoform X2 [Pelodiscus sinensis]
MELSEYVQSGLQVLADSGCFSPRAYTVLLQTAFQSLLNTQADQVALAAATCILEAGKHKADKSAISTYLEDCKFDRERIEQFFTEYQKNKATLEIILGSIGRCPLHITDVSWRLEYQIKTNQLHKAYRPAYLVTLNVENNDSRSHPDVSFSCTMEQLQDLVGKLKDAAKSLERASQM